MTSKNGSSGEPGQESVVLASFDSYRHAESMLASLGRRFRSQAREGEVAAVVVTGNPDGSLKLTQSRVLTAGGFVNAVIRISLAWMVGFMGMVSMLRGTRGGIQAARMRQSHVGSGEHRAHEILDDAGPKAAVLLVVCETEPTRQTVAAAAAERAVQSWDGLMPEFRAALDPGSGHDWVRNALAKASRASHTSRHRPTEQPPQ